MLVQIDFESIQHILQDPLGEFPDLTKILLP